MLTSKMGPQFEGNTGLQHLPAQQQIPNYEKQQSTASADPNTQHLSLLSQLSEINALNSTLQVIRPQETVAVKLDRSISYEPNAIVAASQNSVRKLNNNSSLTSSHAGPKNVVNPSRYKTEVCRPYNENGFCKYGDKCQFAHGEHELRGLPRHPKYKTEPCRTFHTLGVCPYGPRCHFIHSENESKLVEISQMKQQQAAEQAAKEMAQLQLQHQVIQAQLKALVSQYNHSQLVRPKLLHSVSVHPLMRDNLNSVGDTPPDSTSGSPPVLSPVFTDHSDSLCGSSQSGFSTPPAASFNSSFNFPTTPTTSKSCSLSSSLSSSASSSTGEASPLTLSPVKQTSPPALTANNDQFDQLIRNIVATSDSNDQQQLAAMLQSLSLNNSENGVSSSLENNSQSVFTPSSSPESKDSTNNSHYRLPVFSRLASES